MTHTLGLKNGENFYRNLKREAKKDLESKSKLEAVHRTLDHFGIRLNPQREVTAEAILRLDALQECASNAMRPEPTDVLAVAMFRLARYFKKLLAQ